MMTDEKEVTTVGNKKDEIIKQNDVVLQRLILRFVKVYHDTNEQFTTFQQYLSDVVQKVGETSSYNIASYQSGMVKSMTAEMLVQ